MSYQKLVLIGNLGRDPEMRYLPDGTAVTNLSVAVNDNYTGKDGNTVKRTTWFRVTVWGKQGESANQYLTRGSKALIEGTLVADPLTGGPKVWTRQDGTAGASFEVRAQRVVFLSGRGDAGGYETGAPGASTQEEDEIPF